MTRNKKVALTVVPMAGVEGDRRLYIDGHVFNLTDGPPTRRMMHDAEFDTALDRRECRRRWKRSRDE